MVPYEMNSFRYNCSPSLSHNFIQANGSHVLQLRISSKFRCQLNNFILEPSGGGSMDPDMGHVIKYSGDHALTIFAVAFEGPGTPPLEISLSNSLKS